MEVRQIHEIELLIVDGNRDQALDRTLELATEDPLDDDLHHLLGRLVEDHPFRHEPPDLTPWTAFRSVKPFTVGEHRNKPWAVFYTLPETHAVLPLPGFRPRTPMYKCNEHWQGLTTPQRIVGPLPLHAPDRGAFSWYEPNVHFENGVLTLSQYSVFMAGRRGTSNEDIRLRVSRVRGDLVHARYARYSLWS